MTSEARMYVHQEVANGVAVAAAFFGWYGLLYWAFLYCLG